MNDICNQCDHYVFCAGECERTIHNRNTILSLFDLTGNWSKPYKDNGFKVVQVDLQLGIDILNWDYKKYHKMKFLEYCLLVLVQILHYQGLGILREKI